ncbi:MAG: DUF6498-containing protein [Opitutaceae bacterium]
MDTAGNPPPATSAPVPATWLSAWPDALAFGGGLALAWWFQWQVRDLVWSLWLSSLLVGYAMIVWNILRPVIAARREAAGNGAPFLAQAGITGFMLLGALFMLAFFTFHFGMFHFVHSAFLSIFFPVSGAPARGFPSLSLYLQVLAAYWPFVLVAAVAERKAFRPPVRAAPDTSVKAADVNRRLAEKAKGGAMMEPYKNVIRLHLLIFFFAFAHFARLENFFVYAVVYAVYFFPWRLVRKNKAAA